MSKSNKTDPAIFQVFNEINIIGQLSRTWLENRLPDDMRLAHFSMLNHCVLRGDGQTFAELANAFQVSKPAITNTIQRLLKRGYVEVRPDPKDARTKRLYLTPAGKTAREKAVGTVGLVSDLFKRKISGKEFETILPSLRRIREILDEERDRK